MSIAATPTVIVGAITLAASGEEEEEEVDIIEEVSMEDIVEVSIGSLLVAIVVEEDIDPDPEPPEPDIKSKLMLAAASATWLRRRN
jgi:hypothetical protein